jgi:hypothetical protein
MKSLITEVRRYLRSTRTVRFFLLKIRARKLNSKIQQQLQFHDEKPLIVKKNLRVLIPLIETSHYQFYQVLALAKSLEIRGAHVKVLLCDSRLNGCELKSIRTPKSDPCLTCRFNQNNTVSLFGLDVIKLSDFIDDEKVIQIHKASSQISSAYPKEFYYKGINIIPMTNDSVTRYYFGNVPDVESDKLLQLVRTQHLETAMIGVDVSNAIYSSWKPDALIGNMNVYSAWEPYYRVAHDKNIKSNSVSISPFNYSCIVLNQMDLYLSNKRYTSFLDARKSCALSLVEKDELKNILNERFNGTSKIFSDLKMFKECESITDLIKIDRDKCNIFLFSNIYWDVGMSETGLLYDGVISWVLETIGLLKDSDTCHLYIKPHPAEVFDSASSLKRVVDYIYEKYPKLPDNVTIIEPELKIKTYDLFPYIDTGVVYNGTLGLEMLLKEIPVVIAGLAPYSYLNSISKPETKKEYKEMLLGKTVGKKSSYDEVELFSYFYFIKTLIPWTLTKSAYADNFEGYEFSSLDDLMPGKDKYLDHICNCILDPDNTVIEDWK